MNPKYLVRSSALVVALFAGSAFAQEAAEGSTAEGSTAETEAPTGPAAVYLDQCVRCHGEDGQGQTRMGERYGVAAFTAEFLGELGRDGVRDALVSGRENMDPVEGVEGSDLDALVDYVLSLAD